jgi:hypothetical protein
VQKVIHLMLMLIPTFLFGQATERLTNKRTNETYYVLKSDTTIRNGSYKKWAWTGKSHIEGYYKNGVKDSVWTFYDNLGRIAQKYDYTKKILVLENEPINTIPIKIKALKGSDTVVVVLDKNPVCIGGFDILGQAIFDDFKYTDSTQDINVRGFEYLGFMVDTNGRAVNYSILKGLEPHLDRELLRFFKKLPSEWILGVLNGRKVDVPYTLPIRVGFF